MDFRQEAKNICLASYEILGLSKNGGIGTSMTSLACTLAKGPFRVTLLFLGTAPDKEFEKCREQLAEQMVTLVQLPDDEVSVGGCDALQVSHRVYRWLLEHPQQIVHFHEWVGPGYFSMLAKRLGLGFADTIFCVGVHSPTRWISEANELWLDKLDDRIVDRLERWTVLHADYLWCPSAAIEQWLDGSTPKWERAGVTIRFPHALPWETSTYKPRESQIPLPTAGLEIVFFGRLETRKGLNLFLSAMDELIKVGKRVPSKVTFLGRSVPMAGSDSVTFIEQQTSAWPVPVNIIGHASRDEALQYLSSVGRVAVMPSIADNFLLTTIECCQRGIPFLASKVGGIPETIHASDRDRVLVNATKESWVTALTNVLEKGAHSARLSFEPNVANARWLQWHQQVLGKDRLKFAMAAEHQPLVSVCLIHHDRPRHLLRAVASLAKQDYPNFEVILVDDGSKLPAAQLTLSELEADFASRGWQIIRQENLYLGAARNSAAKHAKGDYLLFMDDDNIAHPNEISSFVALASRTSADIVTCSMELFREEDDECGSVGSLRDLGRWLFPPADTFLAHFINCFGDANALVRRETFISLGGFSEDRNSTHEDWEFFLRAQLAGARIVQSPESYFLYRVAPSSMIRATSRYRNYARSARPTLPDKSHLEREIADFARAMYLRQHDLEAENAHLRGRLAEARHRIADRLNSLAKSVPGLHSALKGCYEFAKQLLLRRGKIP